MLHLKSYLGSIVLAGLLLQGCGSTSDDQATATVSEQRSASYYTAVDKFDAAKSTLSTALADTSTLSSDEKAQILSDLTLKIAGLDATNDDVRIYIDSLINLHSEIDTRSDAYSAIAESLTTASTTSTLQTAGIFSPITDAIGDGLVNVLDTSVGDAVTSAAFDVVLNSEGITTVMIDMARGSATTSEIMVNAMEADWSLAAKMCPMLRESTEFGEKFTALAEEQDAVGRFFFERIDAQMYGCLADAMLLSNNDEIHHEDVSHSTNGYMGLLMERYAADYFITPTGSTDDRRNDKFVSLLLNTGDNVVYNDANKTFDGHGDGNELTNEKFFYSLFKTPNTTDSFVAAMQKVDANTKKMLMDNIFLGQPNGEGEADEGQGNLNIIAIGSAMYDGIYGEANAEGTRSGEYGFASYAGAFVGFAGLIPSDRYMTYAKAFIGAGYQYAGFHGINVWTGAASAAKFAWDAYTTPAEETTLATDDTNVSALQAPVRSAGLGVVGSDWYDDITDLFSTAYANFDASISWGALYDAITGEDTTLWGEIASQYEDKKTELKIAYDTILDGRDENNDTAYPTLLTHSLLTADDNDEVYGLHGLVELAIQEDILYAKCGVRSSLTEEFSCENNSSYTVSDAKAAFTLPQFSELTWSFAYGSAKDGAIAYYDTNVNAEWFADLSSNELVRQYFYPSADNVYIPNWMLAIDWLKIANNYNNATIAETDLNFNSGYFDIYVTSTNPSLLTAIIDENNVTVTPADIDLTTIASLVKEIEVTRVDMGDDTIIAVGTDGTSLDGLYVYKVRAVTPEDTQAVLTALSTTYTNATQYALGVIGLDSSNAANVDTTAVTTADSEDANSTLTVASAE